MMLKLSDALIKSLDKRKGSTRTILCDELQNGKEILLSGRKVPKRNFTGHFRLPTDRHSSTKFCHHLSVSDALLPCCQLGLCDTEFLKEVDPGFEAFVMVDGHNNQIAFTVGREIHGLILLAADGCNFTCAVSQTGNGLDDWHVFLPYDCDHKLVPN
jgi:hypothetical protein